MNNEKILDISWRTIAKISIAVAIFYLFFAVRDILIWFIFALTISVLFNPAVNFLQKRKIPRGLAVVFIYVGTFGFLSILIYLVVPIFIVEIQSFLNAFPEYFEKISPPLKGLGFQAFDSLESFLMALGGTLEGMADNIFSALFTIFGGFFTTLFVIVTAIFLSLEEKGVERTLMLLFPKRYEAQVLSVWTRCQKKVSGWFGARLLACLFVGVISYIAFILFNVRYPFTLALFAGVFNFIPYVGPLLTAVILFLIIFPTEMFKAVLVLITFGLIQQVENSVLSPILMKKFVGLPPALVLNSLVVGASLWGLLGAILSIPLFGILFEFFREFLQKRHDRKVVVV
jgi:predicted PurR-regulated permease PerM